MALSFAQYQVVHQVILFDDVGNDAFNLRQMIFSSNSRMFETNFCIQSNLPYALIIYDTPSYHLLFRVTYGLDGTQTTLDHVGVELKSSNAVTSVLFLPAGADLESPMNMSRIYSPVNKMLGCDSSEEVLLEVMVNDTVWMAIFDATSQGMSLDGIRHCLPKGRHYSILTGFLKPSDAGLLEISLNGVVVQQEKGPFYNYVFDFPRIVSTIVTPKMLVDANEPSSSSAPSATGTTCFSGDSKVEVKGRGVVPMRDLQIGDMIRTGTKQNKGFEHVYGFGHYAPHTVGNFLEVHASSFDSATSLKISSTHMLHVISRGFIPAEALAPGDQLFGNHTNWTVLSIQKSGKASTGLYAPFTPSGTLMVDGIVASSFVAMAMRSTADKENASILVLSCSRMVQLSHQWIAHSFEFPHRVVCHYLGQCPNEAYDEHGISTWVSVPHQAAQWLLSDEGSTIGKNILWMVLILILLVFTGVERCLHSPGLLLFFLAVMHYFHRASRYFLLRRRS